MIGHSNIGEAMNNSEPSQQVGWDSLREVDRAPFSLAYEASLVARQLEVLLSTSMTRT